MEFLNWIIANWYLLIGGLAVLGFIVFLVVAFIKLPLPEKFKKIFQWLLGAVQRAEHELGSGTGKLKLRNVYDWFVTKFPIAKVFISFETFSKLVDDALNVVEGWLEENTKLAEYVLTK